MEQRTKIRKKKKSRIKKIILRTLSTILIVILCIAGYYAYHIYQFTDKIQAKTPAAKAKMVATKKWTGGRVNILLVGGDTRSEGKADNSDSMILLSADPKTHQAEMFSIMRDTFWKIPGHSYQKINAGNLIGGPELAVQTVENFLDIPINFYVETDFQGFKKMVDILGGVDINVEENMNYEASDGTNIHLKQGEQHLNGKLALDYARFRHDAMGDFNRTKRQRELLKALAAKTETSYGILKIPQLLDALGPYVQTNMTTTDMLEIANTLHGVNVSNLQTEQVPQMNDILQRSIPKYGSVLIPNVLATRQYVHEQLDMTDTPTVTAAEQYYWDLYKNGGSIQSSNTTTAGTTHTTTTRSSLSSNRESSSRITSSTVHTAKPATSESTSKPAVETTKPVTSGSTTSSTSGTTSPVNSGSSTTTNQGTGGTSSSGTTSVPTQSSGSTDTGTGTK